MKKERGCGWVMGVLVAMPLTAGLIYWSWCWGWWGRENRLMQYLFQCQCPHASEEARYPDNIDVLLSACMHPFYNGISISPSGRYTLVYVRPPTDQTYLYDRRTDILIPLSAPLNGFMIDEIGWGAEGNNAYYLYDLAGNRLVQLKWILMTKDDNFDATTLDILHKAKKIYVVTPWLAVVLNSDSTRKTESDFIIEMTHHYDYAHLNETIANPLRENGIKFEIVIKGTSVLLTTPDIYLIGGEPPSPGVGQVYQPLLRLRIPLEELDPSARPRVEAQRAQEVVDKRNANVVLIIGIVVLIGLLGLTAFGAFRSLSGQQPRT